jgi:hypothetical protein
LFIKFPIAAHFIANVLLKREDYIGCIVGVWGKFRSLGHVAGSILGVSLTRVCFGGPIKELATSPKGKNKMSSPIIISCLY